MIIFNTSPAIAIGFIACGEFLIGALCGIGVTWLALKD